MNGHDNVYVVGDTTNLPVSKTGSAAHFQGEVDRREHRVHRQDRRAGPRL
jgi:NADH dehydrogenase FAD-containing subunit